MTALDRLIGHLLDLPSSYLLDFLGRRKQQYICGVPKIMETGDIAEFDLLLAKSAAEEEQMRASRRGADRARGGGI